MERKALGGLARDSQLRRAEREQALAEAALERENRRVAELQGEQLAERKRVVEERLHGALVAGLLDELNADEEAELAAFKAEAEAAAAAQLKEMEVQRAALRAELDSELERLDGLRGKASALEARLTPGGDGSKLGKGAGGKQKMSGVQFQLKNRQEIKALANQGQ